MNIYYCGCVFDIKLFIVSDSNSLFYCLVLLLLIPAVTVVIVCACRKRRKAEQESKCFSYSPLKRLSLSPVI